MISIVIVGILATVAVPIMHVMTRRAVLTEAVLGLSAIRAAERTYFIGYGEYRTANPMYVQDDPLLGIRPGDLEGTYFSEGIYRAWATSGGSGFVAGCEVNTPNNQAPKREYARSALGDTSPAPLGGWWVYMDHNGNITTKNIPGSGYPEWTGSQPWE